MAVKIKTQYGDVDISNEVIATIVGGAATDIYGIVGMASKNQIRDNLNDILNRENYSRGVVVRQEHNAIIVDIYIIISYGVKLSEVGRNVQDKVKYNLQSMLGIKAKAVNVFVQGVKITDDLD
ncbi:Asp23/Gls24 family envelope stress response protein [Agrilactobacillus fermenti]|uniref:Asp23/Gls24 family envelope stress response protein n=1 Tax=Agrilactobacillus fermenti TaxID=2586909 RepID=UPI001E489CCA|nr:Asp23/Gls24 family envelope stress response protein [Agrilactobacillus fermenti]MCD2256228.1 Asp23/Gls24 family envelope stress response protein [Agrilactobacillus fermenti]